VVVTVEKWVFGSKGQGHPFLVKIDRAQGECEEGVFDDVGRVERSIRGYALDHRSIKSICSGEFEHADHSSGVADRETQRIRRYRQEAAIVRASLPAANRDAASFPSIKWSFVTVFNDHGVRIGQIEQPRIILPGSMNNQMERSYSQAAVVSKPSVQKSPSPFTWLTSFSFILRLLSQKRIQWEWPTEIAVRAHHRLLGRMAFSVSLTESPPAAAPASRRRPRLRRTLRTYLSANFRSTPRSLPLRLSQTCILA